MTLSITKKELRAYFGSPMAAIFIGTFLLAALFTFFWIETFFARNTADIRPLFRWMPVLLLFLVSALTMRQWSEEQRMGTLEVLLTLPVSVTRLVIGKFLAVFVLVAIALALTLGLPITVSLMGPLDWGPVVGGYLGALLMAAAYIAIGLFISSRTDNQIIALILSVLVSGLFYLVGSSGVTDFFGTSVANFFRALGTGSRFASIERGVVDLRDLVYYLSLTGFFLACNVLSLESKRWSDGANTAPLRRNAILATVLIAANLLAANLWIDRLGKVRIDLTENREYSISEPTRNLLSTLTEPLILRGYFSEKTHPLLAPLVPRIKDMMTEYAIASNGMVQVSFVDPKYDQEAEIEANEQYGIKPVPFQVAGRYEASVVNSYFNILVKYGDQYTTLGFEDLIEVERRKDGQLEVRLRNLEYDLTKSIKKVVYGFQSLASVFAKLDSPLRLVFLVTPDDLPKSLAEVPATVREVADELRREAGGKLEFVEIDPTAKGASAKEIRARYGVQPLAAGLFSPDTFYLHLLVEKDNTYDRVYLGDMTKATIRKETEGVLKRNAAGFLKTIGYWVPEAGPPTTPYQPRPRDEYTIFQQALREDYNLEKVDLSTGHVPGNIDVLLLVAPQGLDDMEKLAIDQYLMRGGAVIALAGNYVLDLAPYSQVLQIKEVRDGITDLLAHYGIEVGKQLVMDRQNEPFPIPVERDLGGLVVREIRQMNYPFFVDVRPDGMDRQNPIVANLPAVTLNWVSPITIDEEKNKDRTVTILARSTSESWLRASTNIQPDFHRYPDLGFPVGGDQQSYPLAVAVQGVFHSYFDGKPDPRAEKKAKEEKEKQATDDATDADDAAKDEEELPPEPIVTESPDSARLVVVGSSEFINDTVIGISRSLGQDRFLNSLEFLHNAVDWAVEDQELLAIRSRGSHARLLAPMSRQEQRFWEWLNYGIALAALLVVALVGGLYGRREKPLQLV